MEESSYKHVIDPLKLQDDKSNEDRKDDLDCRQQLITT